MRHHPRRYVRLLVPAALGALAALLVPTLGAVATTARHAAQQPARGGTIHIAYVAPFRSLDPAQAVSSDWYAINGTLYNGLYQFDRHGQPQLDLAAAPPAVTSGGTVWTFHLRKGVLFHNGTEVTAGDLAYSITRVLDPHLKPAVSWGQSADEVFQGAQEFVAGKAKSVTGIQVLDRYTIRFVLLHPVAVLPDILSESFNVVVPKAVVSRESPSYFASHPIGTGPFMFQSWQKGISATFVRNPHYFHAGKPYVDKVVMDMNVAANVIALKVEKGDLDGFGIGSDIAPADVQQARTDARYKQYLVNLPPTINDFLTLNTLKGPLVNATLRQAIARAINRTLLVRLLGGVAIPANQLYVPLDPQYDATLNAHPIYPYDPAQATALVKASGYKGQPITFYYANDAPTNVSIATGVRQSLQQIGINVAMRGVSSAAFGSLPSTADIIENGMSIDYPDAYDGYSFTMACGAYQIRYCDPAADKLVARAETLPFGAARNALLRQAQARILKSAAQVPTVFFTSPTLISPRVQGFYYQPLFGWQFENYWVKH